MNKQENIAFLKFTFYFITNDFTSYCASDQDTFTKVDEFLEVYIVVEGVNIKDADNRLDAIIIDPNGDITAYAEITSITDKPIELDSLELSFNWANFQAFNAIQILNSTLNPGSTLSANQTFEVEDYLGFGDLQFISGI